jgi:hypothetical protein
MDLANIDEVRDSAFRGFELRQSNMLLVFRTSCAFDSV